MVVSWDWCGDVILNASQRSFSHYSGREKASSAPRVTQDNALCELSLFNQKAHEGAT